MSLGSKPSTQQFRPSWLPPGFEQQQVGLLQALLGLPGLPPPPPRRGLGGAFDDIVRHAKGGSAMAGGAAASGLARSGLMPGGPMGAGGGWTEQPGGGMGNGGSALEQFFGPLVNQANPLQQQATGGISQFLNQPAPEQRAMDISMPALQGILDGKPGQGIMDALQPHFQRNLSDANQVGGRFGSGNAILRSRAVDDFNMLGAQAAQQGQQTQLQAAQMLSLLANSAGQNPFNRMMGAFGVGQQNFMNADLETQRRLQLLGGLLGTAQGLAFNQPVIQSQGGGSGLGGLLGMLGGSFLGPIGAAAGGAVGDKIFGGGK